MHHDGWTECESERAKKSLCLSSLSTPPSHSTPVTPPSLSSRLVGKRASQKQLIIAKDFIKHLYWPFPPASSTRPSRRLRRSSLLKAPRHVSNVRECASRFRPRHFHRQTIACDSSCGEGGWARFARCTGTAPHRTNNLVPTDGTTASHARQPSSPDAGKDRLLGVSRDARHTWRRWEEKAVMGGEGDDGVAPAGEEH